MRGILVLICGLMALTACEIPPRFVEESAQVDAFLARRAYRSACVGLDAADAALREYSAKRLGEYPHVSIATDCVCAALYDAEAGTFDVAVATGLAGSHRDDLAECLAPGLSDARIAGDDRAELVRVLGSMDAGGAYGALEALVRDDPLPAVRAMAAAAVRPSAAAAPTLLEALQQDEEAIVRAAAAAALQGRKGEAVVDAVTEAARSDPDGGVRGEALKAVVSLKIPQTDDMVCHAMLNDADERVRLAAVQAWKGTKRKRALDCIERRMKAFEPDGAVRAAVLETLGASPSDHAAQMLCRNIGSWGPDVRARQGRVRDRGRRHRSGAEQPRLGAILRLRRHRDPPGGAQLLWPELPGPLDEGPRRQGVHAPLPRHGPELAGVPWGPRCRIRIAGGR